MATRRTSRILTMAAVIVTAALTATGTTLGADRARAAAEPSLTLSGLRTLGARQVTVVADVRPTPLTALTPRDVTVTADDTVGGTPVPVTVQPLLRDRVSMSLVVDASAQAAESTIGGGLSGITSFLLQAPAGATLSVVADQQPPVLAAPPKAGYSSALSAASGLQPAGERATSDALSLALRQAAPGIVVLYTSAPDAGGEPAAALAARIRAAGAVLAVVTTNPALGYWTATASSTGGLALVTTPGQAIPAFDRLANELRSRSVLTFTPPGTASAVSVRVRGPGGPVTAALPLGQAASAPTAPPASTPAADPAPDTGGSSAWIWAAGAAIVLVAVLILVAVVRARRRRAGRPATGPPTTLDAMAGSPEAQDLAAQVLAKRNPDLPPMPDSWFFDVHRIGPAPEENGSLFEPRAARDAREAMEHEHAQDDQPDDHQDDHPANGHPRLSGPMSQRFKQIRQSLREPPAQREDEQPGEPG